MKKKIIIIATIIIGAIIIIISKQSPKVIYSSLYDYEGIIPVTENIEIYNNGLIKKKEKAYTAEPEEKEITKKISKKELKDIKEAIEKVEKCKLNIVDLEGNLEALFSDDIEIYINLNKKIIIKKQGDGDKYTYDNIEVEELNKLVANIINKYLEEE